MPFKKKVKPKEPSLAEYAIVPPDGGWGWVVVLAAFYCNAVTDGILFTFGIFMDHIKVSYNTTEVNIALIGSLMYGIHLIAGPLCAAMTKAFGIRPLVVFGSLIVSASLASVGFNPPLWFLTIMFGVVAGIGLCFIFMLSITITAMYFTRMRLLAVAIVVCGTGLGTLVFAQACSQMLKRMTWQEAHYVLSGCSFVMAIAALCFKPLEPIRIDTSANVEEDEVKSMSSFTSLWDEELDDQAVVYVAQSRKHSIQSAYDASNVALGVFCENLVEEKAFLKDNLARTWARWCCRRRQNRVLVINPKTREDLVSITSDNRQWAPKSLKTTKTNKWQKILHSFIDMQWSLLYDYRFVLFCLSTSCATTGIIIVFTFETAKFVAEGYTEDDATMMLTILGLSNMCWRLILGALSLWPKINYHALNAAGHCLAGIMTLASVFIHYLPFNYVYCVLLGMGLACFAVFRPVILLELVGMENMSDATGIALFFNGLLATLGPPLGGMVRSETGNFKATYIIAGILFLISGMLLALITGGKPRRIPQEALEPVVVASTA